MVNRKAKKNTRPETELVIIGGGGAGLAAAVAAAENGVEVVVLDKGALGGNSALALGMFAAESPVQRRLMIDCRKNDCFKIAMNFSHWRLNPRLVRAFIDKSGDTIRWLEEKGSGFNCLPFYPNQMPPTWHVPNGRGAGLIKILVQACKKLGVKLNPQTPAKKLLIGTEGEIRGVVTERDGKESEITTMSTIIATGGYGGNQMLLKKYCSGYPESMERIGLPHMGDGLVMAKEAGAATEDLGMLMMSGPTPPHHAVIKIGDRPNILSIRLMAFALEPYTIWVNKRGKRFADESVGFYHFMSSNAVARQPDSTSYTIFDYKMVKMMTERGLFLGMGVPNGSQGNPLPGLEKAFKSKATKGALKVSDSWEGIADWIGVDPKDLKTTIDEYNINCNKGHDPVFAKDPQFLLSLQTSPYYAIKCHTTILNTVGGIKINEKMQVLDKKDSPIKGLYAAGVDVGGWQTETYCGILSGAAFGFAINSGRIAGEEAFEFIRNSK